MDFPPFASLGHVRILLVPVGTIKKETFNKWANLIRSFQTIRLGDIPPDSRDDRARFMPSPLSTGHLHLSYPSHPPPASHAPLFLLRPSDFPLGVIGIASCSASTPLPSLHPEFNASVAQLFPTNSLFPLSQNCYVFEDDDGNNISNSRDLLPGMVIIPNVMGNKGLYVGTLLAELCSNILGEFSNLARTVESPIGMESLNTSVFPLFSFSDQKNHLEALSSSRHSLPPVPIGPGNNPRAEFDSFRSPTPPSKRSSAYDAGRSVPNRNVSLAANVTSKSAKRQSGISMPHTGRLFKLLGDLFLLAGRCSDAGVWYGESLSLLSKFPQDIVWQASALEGLCTTQVLEAWSTGHGIHTSFSNEGKEPWLDISEKLNQATALYTKATPGTTSLTPETESSLIVLLLTTCVCRHCALLFSVWASKGWGPLAFTTLIQPGLPPTFIPRPPTEAHRLRMSAMTGISRGQIAGVLAYAHGPLLLHLEPHDRIRLLQRMATIYAFLGFRRKEVFIIREILSSIMDIIVCGRDETIKSLKDRGGVPSALGSASTGLGIIDTGAGTVGIRESESADGNESIIRLVKYVCEVYGVDLETVKIVTSDAKDKDVIQSNNDPFDERGLQFGWDELQLGVVREAAAIAEALPDYPTVAQFSLSALKALYEIISPTDQEFLYTNSIKALMTARRRGDDRRVQYWSENPVVRIEISPLAFVQLPVEHSVQDLVPSRLDVDVVTGSRDPFIYNPRLSSSKSTSQVLVVQNEPIEFVVTLRNSYAFDFELQNLALSTSGVPIQSQPVAVTIPANSYHTASILGTPLEHGTLIVRGCVVQTQGGTPREFLVPLATDEEERAREKRRSARNCEIERFKESGLDARSRIGNKLAPPARYRSSKASTEMETSSKFLECNVVPQQPLLRIRRTSLTHGAVMMYDGETSTIRLTVENVSAIPIEFIQLTFDDSTIASSQQALSEGNLPVFETYETEYQLLRRPVFSWDAKNEPKVVLPGKRAVLSVTCSGKVGCTSGIIQMSYSHVRRETLTPSDVFYTRQVLYPVLVTVYNTLECHGMDILPFSSIYLARKSHPSGDTDERQPDNWFPSLGMIDETDDWSLFTVDVRNTYGNPFEVTFDRDQASIPVGSVTRLVAPGSTSRIILPVKRFLLAESQTSLPIPTLSDRQFVVSKSNLTTREEKHQRELFWYREELFKYVKGRWKEAGGSRFGFLSLRQQRFTAPMLASLRTDRVRVRLFLVHHGDGGGEGTILPSHGGKSSSLPNELMYLRATITNLSASPHLLTLSLNITPSEHVLHDGVLSDIVLGSLQSGEDRSIEFGICFVSEGRFDIHGHVRVIGGTQEDEVEAGAGVLRVFVQSER